MEFLMNIHTIREFEKEFRIEETINSIIGNKFDKNVNKVYYAVLKKNDCLYLRKNGTIQEGVDYTGENNGLFVSIFELCKAIIKWEDLKNS